MKEEVGMKQRHWRVWHVVAAAGLLALMVADARAQEDVYENATGLNWSNVGGSVGGQNVPLLTGATQFTGFAMANADLNPNGVGQYLYGAYYDVREIDGESQVVNFGIVNTNTKDNRLPTCTATDLVQGRDGETCFNPNGGILAKVRFRDSKFSQEVLDFNIALSCGEVWTGAVKLGAGGVPEIVSKDPVVVDTFSGNNTWGQAVLTTSDEFVTPLPFPGPLKAQELVDAGFLTTADYQRGYMEVIGIAALPCAPVGGGQTLRTGNNWQTLNQMASEALAGEVAIVRVKAGESFIYTMDAITRFRAPILPSGSPSASSVTWPTYTTANSPAGVSLANNTPATDVPSGIFAEDTPNLTRCQTFPVDGSLFLGTATDCTRQFNLILAKGRILGQYDVNPATSGGTAAVITQPTKWANCQFSVSDGKLVGSKTYPGSSFSCSPDGETIGCGIYDRLEHFATTGFVSPSRSDCRLPREVSIWTVDNSYPLADTNLNFDTSKIPNRDVSQGGWLYFQLDVASNDPSQTPIRNEIFPTANRQAILGGRVSGYRGLPTLGLILQEYANEGAGGVYGGIVKAQGDDPVLQEGQS